MLTEQDTLQLTIGLGLEIVDAFVNMINFGGKAEMTLSTVQGVVPVTIINAELVFIGDKARSISTSARIDKGEDSTPFFVLTFPIVNNSSLLDVISTIAATTSQVVGAYLTWMVQENGGQS